MSSMISSIASKPMPPFSRIRPLRTFVLFSFLVGLPALAGPPGLAPPGERRGPPTPELLDEVQAREVEILAVVKENDPGRYEQLMEAKEDDERGYWRQMVHVARMVERFHGDPEFAKRSLDMRDLQKKIKAHMRLWEAAGPDEQTKLRQEMVSMTETLFEFKQEERRQRLTELQDKIQKLESDIEDRDQNKSAKITEYLESLERGRVDL
jgi:hypothetical protein